MNEKMRKPLGAEHKDLADAVVKAQTRPKFAHSFKHLDMLHSNEVKEIIKIMDLTPELKTKIQAIHLKLIPEAERQLHMNRTP